MAAPNLPNPNTPQLPTHGLAGGKNKSHASTAIMNTKTATRSQERPRVVELLFGPPGGPILIMFQTLSTTTHNFSASFVHFRNT